MSKRPLTPRRLRELAREKILEAEADKLTGPEKLEKAISGLITAVDEAHTYPDSWGLAGKLADMADGPLIRIESELVTAKLEGAVG